MKHSTGEAHDAAQMCCRTTRYFGKCDKMLVGLAILVIMRASPALAGEQVLPTVAAVSPDFTRAGEFAPTSALAPTSTLFLPLSSGYQTVPSTYQAVDLPAFKSFSPVEFRPRGHSILEKDSHIGDAEAPMLRGTTVWQRLSDYRSRDRVRVVTLWETGGGNVSLQAGRKGDPSLQWTSRLMNRGGATRGLLDQMFSTSLGGVARRLHLTPHATGTDALGTSSRPMENAFGNAGTGTNRLGRGGATSNGGG